MDSPDNANRVFLVDEVLQHAFAEALQRGQTFQVPSVLAHTSFKLPAQFTAKAWDDMITAVIWLRQQLPTGRLLCMRMDDSGTDLTVHYIATTLSDHDLLRLLQTSTHTTLKEIR